MNKAVNGWINGIIGVAIFSGSLPATRLAVADFNPIFLTCIRAIIAAILGLVLLLLLKQPKPKRDNLPALFIVALGCVIGFPLLTGIALKYIDSAHSIVFVGLLPLSTAVFAVLRTQERPKPLFWVFSLMGALCISLYVGFTGIKESLVGDLLMITSIVVCGWGYAEGAKLSQELGGWQVICWALVLSMPILLPIAIFMFPTTLHSISTSAWIGLMYVSVFSMLVGFVFWYKGLAQGGIAAVGQLQLLQPFLGLLLAAALLHENVSYLMIFTSIVAVICVIGAKKYAN
nr:DMT family transporter [Moraxella sp. CTOTU49097]